MGSFNALCGISGLTITYKTRIRAFVLLQETQNNFILDEDGKFKGVQPEPDDSKLIPLPLIADDERTPILCYPSYYPGTFGTFGLKAIYNDYGDAIIEDSEYRIEAHGKNLGLDLKEFFGDVRSYKGRIVVETDHYAYKVRVRGVKYLAKICYVRDDVYKALTEDIFTRLNPVCGKREFKRIKKDIQEVEDILSLVNKLRNDQTLSKDLCLFKDLFDFCYKKPEYMRLELLENITGREAKVLNPFYREQALKTSEFDDDVRDFQKLNINLSYLGLYPKTSLYGSQYDNSKIVKSFYRKLRNESFPEE